MSKFYTNILVHRNRIVEIGYEGGQKFMRKHKFQPTIGIETNEPTEWKPLKGNFYLKKKKFEDIRSYNEYVKEYSDTINLHGVIDPIFQFINKHYQNVEYDLNLIKVLEIDIEVLSDSGFPKPEDTKYPITSIAIKDKQTQIFYVLATKDFDKNKITDIDPKSINFKYCKSEEQLLSYFIHLIDKLRPDILIGWYSLNFDFPYIINRAFKILPEGAVLKLSPLRTVKCKEKNYKGKIEFYSTILGITLLDYIDLYKKYIFTPRESYSLDFIAEAELGENKIDYSEYDNLSELWEKNPQKYIEYNIQDVELIDRLDNKLKLINLLCTITYSAGCNYYDALGTIKMWDVIFYRELMKEGIMAPPKANHERVHFAGAYVKQPKEGIFKWVFTGDLNSLYPMCQIQFNISPECLVEDKERENVSWKEIDDKLLSKEIEIDQNYILAGNGHYFRKDKKGFVPKILEKIYSERVIAKKEMLKTKQELEDLEDNKENEGKRQELINKIAKLHNIQMAKKIMINSEYGFLGNPYSRYYDPRLASAVTLSGQWAIKWISTYLMTHSLQKKWKWEIVYSDTDSCCITCDYVVKVIKKKFPNIKEQKLVDKIDKFIDKVVQPIIDEGYEKLAVYCNANENKMVMKREKIISSVFWVAKKKYAMMVIDDEGVRYKKPKLKVKGIEIVRSSTPQVCRDKLKKAVELVLTDQEKLNKFLKEFKKDFKLLTPEEIAFPRGCNNLLKNSDTENIYSKGTPIHVRAALLYNKFILDNDLEGKFNLIQEGEKIKFIYMKKPNPIHENVFGFIKRWPSDELVKYVDYDLQYFKSFESVINGICEKVGIEINRKDVNLENVF